MTTERLRLRLPHRHRAVRARILVQRHGIPYELERTICGACSRVLSEQPLRRASA